VEEKEPNIKPKKKKNFNIRLTRLSMDHPMGTQSKAMKKAKAKIKKRKRKRRRIRKRIRTQK